MAGYNLYEKLKERTTARTGSGEEMHLDDVARVKVLSPGRKVFKRFIRNRLAVFGTVTLIVLFFFSFFGPLLYRYGQKQIFYKYDVQYVDYALARDNTTYTGHDAPEGTRSVQIENSVLNSMNSRIKSMEESGQEQQLVSGTEESYLLEKGENGVWQLSSVHAQAVAVSGNASVEIGTYDFLGKTLTFNEGEEVEGLEEAARANVRGKSGTFELNGVTYSFEKGAVKSYTITAQTDGFRYLNGGLSGTAADAEDASAGAGQGAAADGEEATADAAPDTDAFEAAALAAADGEAFTFSGETYIPVTEGESTTFYRLSDPEPLKLYSLLNANSVSDDVTLTEEFLSAALDGAYRGEAFTYEGETYSIQDGEDEDLQVVDGGSDLYAVLTSFIIRRYTGEDTMAYGLKRAIEETIRSMQENKTQTGTLTYELPEQGESGQYIYDDDGNLRMDETELTITQRNTGEYVINCDQINYIIDMYAHPSLAHPLGTDGDGFDVLSRIMYGGRVSLMVGFIVVFIEVLLGVIMGGLAGYYGGWVDNLIMRLVDIFYCLPTMPIMIILGAMMDAARMDTYVRLMVMMAALGIMGWAGVARLVRGQILSLREQEFMVATEATGIRVRSRIFRHLIPNVMPQLIVTATMGIGDVILTESTLSFLGLGVKHPLATWGTIINSVSTASAMAHYAFIWIPTGLLICLTVIAFNFVGDGLRDAYDPKSRS